VSVLDVTNCRKLRDLSPLRGLPLNTLGIGHTGVSDLSPLAGMPLRSLWMADTPVKDLSPLRRLPLKTLYMDKCPLPLDVTPLAEVADLEEVILPENATGVKALQSLPRLRRISYTFDLKAGRPACDKSDFWRQYDELNWLQALRSAGIPLAATQLPDGTWKLAITDAAFAELDLLKAAPISQLFLQGTSVTKLQPLLTLPLRRLRLDATPCSDVSVLAALSTLESLVLPRGAKDLEPLKAHRGLKRLAYDADAAGEPALEAPAFWEALRKDHR
jgi:hypothetical protein